MFRRDPETATIPGQFELRRQAGGAFYILSADRADELEALLASPPIPGETIGTGKGRTGFYGCGELEVALKEYRHGGALAPLLRDFYLGPPHRSVEELRLLAIGTRTGLPVPRPLAATVEPVWGPVCRYRLCTARVRGGRNLLDRLRDGERGFEEACALALRRFHDGGLLHRDLNLANFIIGDQGVFICDLDRGLHRASLSGRARRGNLARLERSVAGKGLAAAFSMERFLLSYRRD